MSSKLDDNIYFIKKEKAVKKGKRGNKPSNKADEQQTDNWFPKDQWQVSWLV